MALRSAREPQSSFDQRIARYCKSHVTWRPPATLIRGTLNVDTALGRCHGGDAVGLGPLSGCLSGSAKEVMLGWLSPFRKVLNHNGVCEVFSGWSITCVALPGIYPLEAAGKKPDYRLARVFPIEK